MIIESVYSNVKNKMKKKFLQKYSNVDKTKKQERITSMSATCHGSK